MITSKLRGGGYQNGVNFLKYNAAKNIFDKSKPWTYSIRYNFNCSVSVVQISMLSQLRGNDFVLALVDSMSHQFTDQYGKRHYSAGLTNGRGGPAVVSYIHWQKNRYLGVHEFFHTLGLDDIEGDSKKDRLMYHLEDNTGKFISDKERGDMMKFMMLNLLDMTKVSYNNANLNTVNKLRFFIKDNTNGFKYNKAKFR